MANEIEEVRYQVGEAWKGEYNAATPYGVAAVVQDPTGLSVYRSLKNGNTGHPLTDTNWWFCIIDMSSIKAASDNVDALNTEVSEDEAARVSAENNRVTAENNRVTAESGRVTAENGRVSAENGRVTAESARVSAESARATAESSRATAESARVSAENARVLAENLRDNAESSRATAETNRAAAESERHTQYTADHNAAASDHTTAQLDHTTAVADHEQATADHTASVAATGEASNVNAEIDGLVVTITDRNGQSHSVNIGFDIAGTYASVAAMNADAANVQEGAFVMIATLDPTSQENARLYVRNSTAPTSSEPFTFLSDLDQAATSAWADWMENYKPTITADHTRAEADHTTAAADHTAAVSDHNTATTDHTQAASDHSTAASDHTAAASDHTRAESDHTTAAADHTQAEFDHSRAETDHNTMEPRIANLEENKANKDGYYSQMTVGAAETLVGETIDSADYLIRPTGGADNEVANGAASVIGMEGHTEKFNQLVIKRSIVEKTQYGVTVEVNDGYFSFSGTATQTGFIDYNTTLLDSKLITGHKVYIKYFGLNTPKVGMYFGSGNYFPAMDSGYPIQTVPEYASAVLTLNLTCRVSKDVTYSGGFYYQLYDLTAIFGAGNEPSTVADVEAWLAKNVGLKPYYGYNAGSLLSAQTLGVKTYGQNLLNPTTRQARLIPYTWEENSNVYTIKNVPSGATATFTPDATGVAESVTITNNKFDITNYGSGILELSAATAETYVCMKWDEQKDDDVVPYEEHTQEFDVRKVYGKVNGAGEYVQCFPNGLRSAGSVKDTLTAVGATKVIGDVDLGGLNYSIYTWYGSSTFVSKLTSTTLDIKSNLNFKCYKYKKQNASDHNDDKFIIPNSKYNIALGNIVIRDTSYTDAATFKASLNGVPLYYELATPITYTDLVYRDGGIDTPITDVLFNIEVNNWSIEEQLLTPYVDGNPTAVPAKISTQYGMDAVEEIDTIKHTYVSAYSEQNFSDSQKAQARRNIGAVEENGTYPNMSVGIAKNLAGENAVEAEYTYRPSNGTIGTATGIANVTAVKGKTLKWNQVRPLIPINLFSHSGGTTAVLSTSDNGKTYTITASSALPTNEAFFKNRNESYFVPIPSGHKVYINKGTLSNYIAISGYNNEAIGEGSTGYSDRSSVFTVANTGSFSGLSIAIKEGFSGSLDITPFYIDLTDLFGAGNEPTTVAEFEALYPLDYYDYTATPVLINNDASGIVTTGFNQCDEIFESDTINVENGEKIPSPDGPTLRTKNFQHVLPNTEYYFPSFGAYIRIAFYDSNFNFISGVRRTRGIVATPNNAHYMKYSPEVYGTTYNNNICINLSDTAKNGTYEPYEKHTFYFDKVLQGEGSLATVKGKLNGEGESVVVFPDGLRKAGNVFDEIKGNVAIKRIGSVDLGTLNWTKYTQISTAYFRTDADAQYGYLGTTNLPNIISAVYNPDSYYNVIRGNNDKRVCITDSNRIGVYDSSYSDAAAFKAAMSGVILYYELATPETYILDQTVTGGYQVNALGTERRLPEDTASAVNAPVSYSVIYPIDAVGTITKLPINYISEKSLTNFTTELASKLGTFLNATIGISATYNQTTQEYDYSISINANE